MGLQIGIGSDGDLSLWCEDRGFTSYGGLKFWVINGHWAGVYHRGVITIGYDDDDNEANAPRGRTYPGKLIWRGHTPFRSEDYNEAMAWLRSHLKRQPELKQYFEGMKYMATKDKIKFGEAVATIDAERHNERVSALAAAYTDMAEIIAAAEARVVEMRAYQAEISTKGEEVENLSDEEYAELYNRRFKFSR